MNVMSLAPVSKMILILSVLATIAIFAFGRCSADPVKSQDIALINSVPAQYAQINDAIVKRDLDKIMSYFTDDFTEVNSTGSIVGREQERKAYQDELGKIKSMQIHYTIENVDNTANGTYCDVKFHMDGVGFKRVLFMKIQGTFTNDLMVHDLWVSTPTGWRLKSRQCLLDETKVAAN